MGVYRSGCTSTASLSVFRCFTVETDSPFSLSWCFIWMAASIPNVLLSFILEQCVEWYTFLRRQENRLGIHQNTRVL